MDYQTTYHISGMDCPCEERLIRLNLQDLPIKHLEFDLERRQLTIHHEGTLAEEIEQRLVKLNLGAKQIARSESSHDAPVGSTAHHKERRILIYVLVINFVLFVAEMLVGLIADSMGLVADSLDMLADALVYGMSLMAVGMAVAKQKRVATMSGYLQMGLAVLGIVEVVRRFLGWEEQPDFVSMIWMSAGALVGNALCVYLLQSIASKGVHIKASLIFSANDVLINIGVIVSALLVYLLDSRYPDLIVGSVIFVIVVRGALKILSLGR